MAKKKVEDIVSELVLPITDKFNYELVDVEYVKEGSNWYLRIYIDKENGIEINDCEVVSRELGDKLDEADPIKESYILEVSSPGLTRPLKKDRDFIRNTGKLITVNLFKALEGKKEYVGVIKGIDEDGKLELILSEDNVIKIERSLISLAKLNIEF